jgi:sec-independent protein translocase protein TatC
VAAIGVLFQIPVGVLAITRLRILTPAQLAKNRGYVILGIAILAAVATPTPDPVTMSLAMAPLIVLFELSILLARWIDRIKPPADDEDGDDEDDPEDDDVDLMDDVDDGFDVDEYVEHREAFDDERGDGARLDPPTLTDSKPKD